MAIQATGINRAIGRPVTYSTAGDPDVVVDVLRTADSDWQAGLAAKLTDGLHGIAALSGNAAASYHGWNTASALSLTLDLQTAREGVAFRASGYYGTDSVIRPLSVKLESSDDNSAWTTVSDKTGLAAGGTAGRSPWLYELDISAAGSHRYWRLTLDHGGTLTFVSEVEFWSTESGGRDWTLGRDVTTSTAPHATYPNFAVDVIRDGDTDWAAAAGHLLGSGQVAKRNSFTEQHVGFTSGSALDITFTVDLSTAREVKIARVFGSYGSSLLRRPKQAKLEYSDDGSAWTTVTDKSGLTGGGQPGLRGWMVEYEFAAQTRRYWRWTLELEPDWLFVSKIELLS